MQTRRLALIALVSSLALVLAFAYAHVMTYYPVGVTLTPTEPKVVFAPGSNAGATDVDGSTIGVSIGDNGANLTLTIHPTYETTYYKNITIIENTGSVAYSVNITVNKALSLPAGSKAYLVIYNKGAARELSGWPIPLPNSGTYVAMVDLTTTNTTTIGSLGAGGIWEVDLLVYIPEGSTPSTTTAELYLVSSPS